MLSSPCRVFTRSWFSQRRTWSQSASNNARYVPVLLTGAAVSAVAVYFYWPRPSRSAPTYHKVPLSPSHFTPVTLSSCETTSRDTKLFTLTVLLHLIPDEASLTPIWSVFIKDDDIQVERPYTPLEGIDSQGRMTFWIKKYPNGEVGRWLHSKDVGDTIEIRGPLRTWEWQHDVWDEVIMISGGTGITPMYQLLHNMMSRGTRSDLKTRFTLLHSSRTPADLPPPFILQRLSSLAETNPDWFKLHLFVDSHDGSKPCHKLHVARIDEKAIRTFGLDHRPDTWWRIFCSPGGPGRKDRKRLFIVCGPEPMISSIAGPFGKGFSQGQVGGALGRMGYTPSEVHKL